MNQEIKARWVAALRSGEYKQAREALTDGEGFCCLGVLCDLHARETGGLWDAGGFYHEADDVLPPVVVGWAGLDDENPRVGRTSLGVLNDGEETYDEEEECVVIVTRPRSFAEIAKAIEKYL